MANASITNFISHDGSRHFLSLRQSIPSDALVAAMKAMPDIAINKFIETIPESWIDFDFRGHKFAINDQFGEYWFFVKDAACQENILLSLRDRFATILPPH